MAAQVSAHGYRYYAGFSAEFVQDVLGLLGATPSDVVLDPWNGSGTTTLVAAQRGIASTGIDVNPVMVVVAKGRLVDASRAQAAFDHASACCTPAPTRLPLRVDEPLRAWFQPRTAARIRALITHLVQNPARDPNPDSDSPSDSDKRSAGSPGESEGAVAANGRAQAGTHAVVLDDDFYGVVNSESLTVPQAHLLTAAFLTVRSFLKAAMTSNPTWVRQSLPKDDLVGVTWRELTSTYLSFLEALAAHAIDAADNAIEPDPAHDGLGGPTSAGSLRHPALMVADLAELDQVKALHARGARASAPASPDGSAAPAATCTPRATLVLGSPPYCTRIDYAAATRPELAVLGLDAQAQIELRRRMLGTTTVGAEAPARQSWSLAADKLLADVTAHTSRASNTYYRKWLAQYLDGYWNCLSNLSELTESDATIALVVQDSYYKDHHIDLAGITSEYATALGWTRLGRFDFPVPRTMASINPKIRAYRTAFNSTETLLIFTAKATNYGACVSSSGE